MGINLWDIGAFATGAIERDREHTAENLKIRGDELAAKRDSLIRRKDKKYDMEIEAYKKEKDKADKINGLISEAKAFNKANEGKLDAAGNPIHFNKNLFATKYLIASMGVNEYNALTDTDKTNMRNNLINSEGNWASGYQMKSKDPSQIDALQSKEENLILSNYADQLKNAKDDSFLINKILGKSTTVSSAADLEKAVDADIKASEVVSKIDKIEKTSDDKDELLLSEGIVKVTVPKEYDKAFSSARDKITFGNVDEKQNAIDFLTASNWLSADKGGWYKLDDTGKIKESTSGSRALMKTYKDTYNYVLKQMKVENYYAQDKHIGNIGSIFNAAEVHDLTQALLETRAINMDNTEWLDGKKDLKVVAMVPVRIQDFDNTIDFGDGKVKVNSQNVRDEYDNFLREVMDNENLQSEIVKGISKDANKVAAVQASLENGGAYTDIFKTWLKDKDIYLKEEVKVTDDKGKVTETTTVEEDIEVPKGTKKYPVQRMKNGDIGVVINGTLFSIKENLENFKNKSKYVDDKELQSVISEATKFGYNTEKMAPRGPQKYLDQKGTRGTKKINPAWQKLQDLEKSLTSVKPKKITKKKLR